MRRWWGGSLLLNRRFSRKPKVLILGLALLAEGCLLGPNFKVPPAPVADKWVEEGNKAVDSGFSEHRDWWTVFNDPVLTRLVDLAYQQNLTLRTAGVRVLEARAQLGIAIGEFYPQQQLASAAVTYNRLPISFPFNIASNTYWQAEFGAQAGWEIDIWGKLRRAIESADSAFLASLAN
jgi:outer membrane protein TolC